MTLTKENKHEKNDNNSPTRNKCAFGVLWRIRGGGNGGGTTQPQTWFNLEEKYPELVAAQVALPGCIAQAYSLYETVKGTNGFSDGALHVVLEGEYAPLSNIFYYTAEHSVAGHTDFYQQLCQNIYGGVIYTELFSNITAEDTPYTAPVPPANETFSIGKEVLIGITAPEFTFEPGRDDKVRAPSFTKAGTLSGGDSCFEYESRTFRWNNLTC